MASAVASAAPATSAKKVLTVEPTPHEIQLARNCYRNVSQILHQYCKDLMNALDNAQAEAPDMALLAPVHNRLVECLTFVYARLLADAKARDIAINGDEPIPANIKQHAQHDNVLAYALLVQLNAISVIQAAHLRVLHHRDTLLPESALAIEPEAAELMRTTLRILDSFLANITVTSSDTSRFVPSAEKLTVPESLLASTQELQVAAADPDDHDTHFFTGGDREVLLRMMAVQRKRMLRIKTSSPDGVEGARSSARQVKRLLADLKAYAPSIIRNPVFPTVLTAKPVRAEPEPQEEPQGSDDNEAEGWDAETQKENSASASRQDVDDANMFDLLVSSPRIDNQRVALTPRKEREMELSSIVHTVASSNRLDDQRADNVRELRRKSLDAAVLAQDRAARQLDAQRYVLSPEQHAQMELGDVMRAVDSLNATRLANQDADPPAVRREQRLGEVADAIENVRATRYSDQDGPLPETIRARRRESVADAIERLQGGRLDDQRCELKA